MTERRLHAGPFNREQTHGVTSRASRSVPAALRPIYQSNIDKAAMIEHVREHSEMHRKEELGLGNQELPAFKHKNEVVKIVDEYRASIIGGATGSGKSTQVPQFLYEAGYDKIYVMVPRRVIADNLFERIREEMSEYLQADGVENAIGVMHGERSETHPDNRIVIMTPNTFLRAGNDIEQEHGDKKVAIIADEIHEANVYTEIAAGVGLKSVENHENWRFVAMSATHNEAVLQAPLSRVNEGVVPSVAIEGRPFKLEQMECPDKTTMQAYAEYGGEAAKSMIFTSGKAEIDHIIEKTRNELELRERGSSRKVVFRKLHSELTERELSHINDPVPEGCRLVIVSSPAGMSGITIPGVTHVFSDGTINRSELDENDFEGLSREYLSRAGIIQQFGRAGRDVPGGKGFLCQPTMVEEDKIRDKGQEVEVLAMPYKPFEADDKEQNRADFEPAEIYSTNLAGIMLSVANLDMEFGDINEYLPHKVQPTAISKAREFLSRLGALDDYGKITEIGRQMSEYQIKPELSRGIVEAMRNNRPLLHMARIAIIAAAVGAGGVQDFRDRRSKEWKKLLDNNTQDDMIAQLDIVRSLPTGDADLDTYFITEHDLSYKRVKQTQKVARKIMHTLGISPHNVVHEVLNDDEAQAIRDDLTAGMIDSVYEHVQATRQGSRYRNVLATDIEQVRTLSGRSITPEKTTLIAGSARWFKKTNRNGEKIKYDVVEQTMPVDPRVVAEYAMKAGISTYDVVEQVLDGDMVKTKVQPKFGTILVGEPELRRSDQVIPKEAQDFLVRKVLEGQGYNQKAFRELAVELDNYARRVPAATLRAHLKNGAPEKFVTQDSITSLIKRYAERTTKRSEIDNLLGEHMYSKNIGIEQYFSVADREWLQTCSVSEAIIGNQYFKIQYTSDDARTPYVNASSQRHELAAAIAGADSEEFTLPDGRVIHAKISGKLIHPSVL